MFGKGLPFSVRWSLIALILLTAGCGANFTRKAPHSAINHRAIAHPGPLNESHRRNLS